MASRCSPYISWFWSYYPISGPFRPILSLFFWETVGSSETSVTIHWTARRHILPNGESLISYTIKWFGPSERDRKKTQGGPVGRSRQFFKLCVVVSSPEITSQRSGRGSEQKANKPHSPVPGLAQSSFEWEAPQPPPQHREGWLVAWRGNLRVQTSAPDLPCGQISWCRVIQEWEGNFE